MLDRMPTNRRVILAARPDGFPKESDFGLDEVDVPGPGTGEVLVQISHASIDP
jgi:NADPH-dependent curcumin reductase